MPWARHDTATAWPGSPRVALFLPSLRGGGAEKVMVNLATGFHEAGVATDLVVARCTGPYSADIPAGIRTIDLKAKRVLAALPGLTNYLRKERPFALLAALDHANVIAISARWLARVNTRIVVSVHNTPSLEGPNSTKLGPKVVLQLAKRMYPLAHAVVAVSEGVAQDVAGVTGLSRQRINVILNPIRVGDVQRLSEEPVHHDWFRGGQPKVIVAVGRLTRVKDFPTLLRAFSLVRKHLPVRLMILGEGEDRGGLTRLVTELGLEREVFLPGFVPNPYPYIARASLLVMSSIFEGFGNVLVEALACGTPVVSTNCRSGPSEILDSGRYGRLVEVGDIEGLASAMLASLNEEVPSEELRRRAADFSAEKSVRQYLKLLMENQ